MSRHRMRRLTMGGVVSLALPLALAALPGCGQRTADHGRSPARRMDVGAVRLTEVWADGRVAPFTLRARPGCVLLVCFGFANCPDICPTTLSDLDRARGRLGDDAARVDLAFITVDPARDTAAVLAPYLASFFTGAHPLRPASQAELSRAQAAFGAASRVVRTTDGRVEVTHTGLIYAVDPRGRVRLQWDFGARPAHVAEDLRRLLHSSQEAPG